MAKKIYDETYSNKNDTKNEKNNNDNNTVRDKEAQVQPISEK